eukprot:4557518-Amphidinium_carterae.1
MVQLISSAGDIEKDPLKCVNGKNNYNNYPNSAFRHLISRTSLRMRKSRWMETRNSARVLNDLLRGLIHYQDPTAGCNLHTPGPKQHHRGEQIIADRFLAPRAQSLGGCYPIGLSGTFKTVVFVIGRTGAVQYQTGAVQGMLRNASTSPER